LNKVIHWEKKYWGKALTEGGLTFPRTSSATSKLYSPWTWLGFRGKGQDQIVTNPHEDWWIMLKNEWDHSGSTTRVFSERFYRYV
jgi:hypothetical protein